MARIIEISLPNLSWKSIVRPRVMFAVALLAAAAYWAFFVRPYLQIEGARLSAMQFDAASSWLGRLAEIPCANGAIVREGETLFSLETEDARQRQAQLLDEISLLKEEAEVHQKGVEQAMEKYIQVRSEAEAGLSDLGGASQHIGKMQEYQAAADQCRHKLESAQAELDRLRVQGAQKIVAAPFSGIIIQGQKIKGAIVRPGDVICSLVDPSRVWIDATVAEADLAAIAIGQKAFVSLHSEKGRKREGSISWISPIARADGKGVPIRIELASCESSEKLLPNLMADVKIKIR